MKPQNLDRVNLWLQRNFFAFKMFEEVGPPEKRFAWLIGLLQEPIDAILANWEESIAPEVAAFAARNADIAVVEEAADLPQAEIKDLLIPLQRGLEQLMSTGSWQLHLLPTSRIFSRFADQFEAVPGARSFQASFLDEVCEAFTTMGRRLAICARPRCGRAFVRRKGGTHCSNACAQRQRTERYMAKLAEAKQLQSKRHKRYVAAVARTKGPAVAKRVRPRSRKNTDGGAS